MQKQDVIDFFDRFFYLAKTISDKDKRNPADFGCDLVSPGIADINGIIHTMMCH